MKKEELYFRIDSDDEMSDSEKRESYFSSLSDMEDYEDWTNSF